MPIEKLDKNTYREYDGLIGLTMLNIYQMSKDDKVIRLVGFDRKNKEHLFVLRVALLARDIYQMPLEIEGSWWNIFCLNWRLRRGFQKVNRYKHPFGIYHFGLVCVPELLALMNPDGKERLGENFSFADIYEAYYEGSCG